MARVAGRRSGRSSPPLTERLLAGAEAREKVEGALASFFAVQKGGAALLTSRKLRRLGLKLTFPYEQALLEHLLKCGVVDPLGRGVWRLQSSNRSSPRKYYLRLYSWKELQQQAELESLQPGREPSASVV